MWWAKRSCRRMLWHIVVMREQNADVMFLSDVSAPEWMSEGNKVVMLGTRRENITCEWCGRCCVVSLFCETVAKFRIGDAHSRKQEVDWSHSSGRIHFHPKTVSSNHIFIQNLFSSIDTFNKQRFHQKKTQRWDNPNSPCLCEGVAGQRPEGWWPQRVVAPKGGWPRRVGPRRGYGQVWPIPSLAKRTLARPTFLPT